MHISLGSIRRMWGWNSPFSIPGSDAKHCAIIGATGSGKSTLLKRIIHAHIAAGHGITVQDPHGDLIDWTLGMIPRHRTNDVIVFAPEMDSTGYIGVNPLHGRNPEKRLKDTLEIVSTLWTNGWGPQSDFMSRNIGAAIQEVIGTPTLLHYDRAFMSREFVERLRARAKSVRVKDFFSKTLDDWDKRQNEAAAAPSTNKFNTFMQPVLRHVVGQVKGLDFERILDGSQILLCNLPIGALGEDIAAVLAHLIQSEILHAAFERRAKKDRAFHALIVDEAQKLARGHDQERFLNEMRKYNIGYTFGAQTVDQIPEGARRAVFNNVATLISGTVGATDADILAAEIGLPEPKTLLGLTPHFWYAKTRGVIVSDPILFEGAPAPDRRGDEAKADVIIRRSSYRHERPRERIERELNALMLAS